MWRWLARGVALATGALWLPAALPTTMPAAADEALVIDERITDRVGALDGRADEVEAAQDRLFDDHRLELYVVYVDGFSGRAAAEWAAEAASHNRFGINQALLVVATGEREYDLALDPEYPLTGAQVAEIGERAVEPALQVFDWVGAAVGAAEGLRAALGGEPVRAPQIVPGNPEPTADEGGLGGVPVIMVGVGVVGAAAAGLAAYAYRRSRRRSTAPDQPSAGAAENAEHQA